MDVYEVHYCDRSHIMCIPLLPFPSMNARDALTLSPFRKLISGESTTAHTPSSIQIAFGVSRAEKRSVSKHKGGSWGVITWCYSWIILNLESLKSEVFIWLSSILESWRVTESIALVLVKINWIFTTKIPKNLSKLTSNMKLQNKISLWISKFYQKSTSTQQFYFKTSNDASQSIFDGSSIFGYFTNLLPIPVSTPSSSYPSQTTQTKLSHHSDNYKFSSSY